MVNEIKYELGGPRTFHSKKPESPENGDTYYDEVTSLCKVFIKESNSWVTLAANTIPENNVRIIFKDFYKCCCCGKKYTTKIIKCEYCGTGPNLK